MHTEPDRGRAVVTGAGSGIGLATGRRLVREGFSVTAIDRDEAGLDRAAAEGRTPLKADLASLADWDKEVEAAQGSRCLVNAAGIIVLKPILDVTIEDLEAAYASTRAAVLSLTRSFAYAFAAKNVRVNAVCPGIIDTPMQDAVLAKVAAASGIPVAELVDARNATVPLKRAASAGECAATFWFLLSPESSYITGQAIDEPHDVAICGFHTGCGLIIRRLKKKGPKKGPNR